MHALVGTLALGLWHATASTPAPASEPSTAPSPETSAPPVQPTQRSTLFSRLAGRKGSTAARVPPTGPPPDGLRFMIGLEGLIFSAPPLKAPRLRIDPRNVGRSVAMGGIGLFGRFRPISAIAVEVGVRSGSVRYNSQTSNASMSQDQIAADAAVLVYLARGQIAQFALSGGMGGMWNRIGYEYAGDTSRQTFGSVVFRVGGEAEFLLKRVAFVLAFRNYAVLTPRDRVNNRGQDEDAPAPVATFQSALMGSVGIAFRF